MNERLEARRRFHEKCERHNWPTTCDCCGNGLEDPENSDYDAFCDFCCAYYNYGGAGDWPQDRRARRETAQAAGAVDPVGDNAERDPSTRD